jgi:transcription antitermination factor NusG
MELHPSWFALTVKPRHEKVAAQNLRLRGLEDFLPLQRVRHSWSDRIQTVELPLFPGYVFCHLTYRDRMHALNTPGVRSIVGFGAVDVPLEDSEIQALQALISSGMLLSPWPYLRLGEKVRIERGALEGVCGTLVREKGSWRIVVNVELLQRSVAVEVDRDIVGPWRESTTRQTCQQQQSC